MARTRQGGKIGLDGKPFRFTDRLKEIGRFFQERSPQRQTNGLHERLEEKRREDEYLAREG